MSHNLAELKIGQTGTVLRIDHHSTMRRRLLDLGVVEGTKIQCLHKSPAGTPVAYLIRGAVIALRNEDSAQIILKD